MEWYPEKLRVSPEGTTSTIEFLKANFAQNDSFTYAEFGIYEGATALAIASHFTNAKLFLFDYEEVILKHQSKLNKYMERIQLYGNSEKYQDSYNWSLSKFMEAHPEVYFDYIFIDGAHTFAVDALTFFICKRLMRPGSYIDFDDYDWKLSGSSLDPVKVPAINLQFTNEQIEDLQVKRIVEQFVRTDPDLFEVVKNKIFQYLHGRESYSTKTTMNSIEIDYLRAHLSKANLYIEFGSGFSTLLASQFSELKIVSFETDYRYIESIRKEIDFKNVSRKIEFVHLDVGPTKEWGWPIVPTNEKLFPNYVMSLLKRINNSDLKPDLILIDGRFRIATFLACCLSFPGSTILFDDYLDRENYHSVENIVKPIRYTGRIGEFRIPSRLSKKKIVMWINLLTKYAYDPS